MNDEQNGETRTGANPVAARIERARGWWRELQDAGSGKGPPGRYRADRARLARMAVDAAMADEAVHRLYRRIGWSGSDFGRYIQRTAALACVLAKVRSDDTSRSFGRQIGRQGDDARLSSLRFKALLKARSDAEIARAFRRAVAMLGGTANVSDLTRIILAWDSETTRARLAFDYYGAGDAAPQDTAEEANP